MKVYKDGDTKLVFEGDAIKNFNIEIKKDGGLCDDEKVNKTYQAFILSYRFKDMKNSKQMFIADNKISLMTLLSSSIESMIRNGVIELEDLYYMLELVGKQVGGK